MTPTKVELEFYRFGKGITESNFSAMLFRLICKADTQNQFKLSKGFSEEVYLVKSYQNVKGWWGEFQKRIEKQLQENKSK